MGSLSTRLLTSACVHKQHLTLLDQQMGAVTSAALRATDDTRSVDQRNQAITSAWALAPAYHQQGMTHLPAELHSMS